MDLVAVGVDVLSVIVFIFAILVGWSAVRAFKQSRQAVTESASLLSVIVNAPSSRIESSESLANGLRSEFESITKRSAQFEGEQSNLRTSYLQVLRYLQEILGNDKRLVLELEQLKSRLTSIEQKPLGRSEIPAHTRAEVPTSSGDILAALTPTERQTVEILGHEGPKAAPDLGRRMRKSREHMARLMKKLYMEGYVDRESNRAPFRYKLNEKVRQTFESRGKAITAAASEKA